jgi:iron complex outermembrane receptor protein
MKRTVLLISLASSLTVFSQDKKDTADLPPVEVRAVTASPTAPFAKTNLDRKEIAKQNLGQDLPFLLNQTPSVVVNSDAGNGVGYTGIHIRGTDATRINVTLNGIPYNDAESQGTYFVDLPDFASSVNRIQIQRGVGTSTNGAGAFGATINFTTNEVNKKPYAEINNSYGSFNTWKNTIKAGTGLLGNHFIFDARVSRISSDGYIDRASTNLKSAYFSTAYLSDKNDLRFNVILGKEKTYQAWNGIPEAKLKNDPTALEEHYYNNVGYLYNSAADSVNLFSSSPRKYNYFTYPNQTDNYWQNHYQLFFTHRFTSNFAFNVAGFLTPGKGYYEEYKVAQDFAGYGVSDPVVAGDTVYSTDLIRRLWLKNKFYGSIFSLQDEFGKTHLTFGGAITKYDGRHFGDVIWSQQPWNGSKRWYDLDAFKKDFNIYGKWQQDLSQKLQLFADVQYRRVKYDLLGFEHNPSLIVHNTYNFFNPKFGLSYHKNHLLLYASYSVAHKEPNRDDFEAGLNQQPKPEKLNDWEAGIERKSSKTFLSADFYYMKYKDQLVLTGKINDVGSYTRTNIPDSYRLGLELQGAAVVNQYLKASANLTLSRNKILNFTEYIDDYDNGGQKMNQYSESDISFSPSVIGGATISVIPVQKLSIDFLSKFVSKQYLDNTNNEARKLNSYFTEDARVIYSFSKNRLKNVDLILQANNVFNKQYESNGYTYSYYYNTQLITENFYYPMAKTNWMFGVNVKL